MAWHLIKTGGQNQEYGFAHKEFLVDSDTDIQTEPTNLGSIASGSMAHTAGYAKIWEKDSNGEWIPV